MSQTHTGSSPVLTTKIRHMKKYIKRYTLTDYKTMKTYHYSELEWNLAWLIAYLLGLALGFLVF